MMRDPQCPCCECQGKHCLAPHPGHSHRDVMSQRQPVFVGDVCISGPESVATVPPVDRTKLCTTDGRSAQEALASQTNETGQHPSYVVLCEEERRKGFVRPYRDAYKHVGALQQLVDDAGADSNQVRTGGCGFVTTMGRALSETYARDPKFYGATFCCRCNRHLPVAEFVWTADGQQVGS